MACFQIGRPGFSTDIAGRPGRPTRRPAAHSSIVRCRVEESNGGSGGEEPTESLFMKELKRRGMTPRSLLEEGKRGAYEFGEKELEEAMDEETMRKPMRRKGAVSSAEYDKEVVNQRERSMALNSEGIEGLIPRAKVLLTIGGTFFLGFWPLILITVGTFASLYVYFGPSFVHDGSKMSISPPPYVDPSALLEDERISQMSP